MGSGEFGLVDIVTVAEDTDAGHRRIYAIDLDASFGITNDEDVPLGKIGFVGAALEVYDAEELLVGYPVGVDEVNEIPWVLLVTERVGLVLGRVFGLVVVACAVVVVGAQHVRKRSSRNLPMTAVANILSGA